MSLPPAAIVTGSSRGIGRAIALELVRLGHAVVVNYASNAEAAAAVVAEIEKAGGQALAVRGSVAVEADRDELVDRCLQKFGRLDVLVNNAGITSPGRLDLLDATTANWDEVFDINLKGPFFLTQRAAQAMIPLVETGTIERGYIINISSIAAFTISTDRGDYCLTKAAMQMMTWLWAARLVEHGIQAFELSPGIIETDMTGKVKERYDKLIGEGLIPMKRWGQPEDVARGVGAIVSGAFPFSTGERINIDGGFHIRKM